MEMAMNNLNSNQKSELMDQVKQQIALGENQFVWNPSFFFGEIYEIKESGISSGRIEGSIDWNVDL